MLLGLGIGATARIVTTGENLQVSVPPNLLLSFVTLVFILVGHAVAFPCMRFSPTRYYAIYLAILFLVFAALTFVVEFVEF